MTLLKDIKNPEWSLSIYEPTKVVEGLSDIAQCIYIIVMTEKGSDPLRPEFGCGLLQYIDAPVNSAIPNMIREITEAINLWEPRVEIVSISSQIEEAHIKFSLTWRTLDGLQQTTVIEYANSN
jgi:uncharacterized protein